MSDWAVWDKLFGLLTSIDNKLGGLMAQSEEINASLDDLNTKTDEAAARLTEILANLKPGMSQAEVDAVKARIKTEADRLGTWGQDASNPIP
jgi:ABC-type transporter Mla subunit MlaD